MFIFNRTTTLNRNRLMEATMAWDEVAGLVTRITGVGVNVFATLFGDTGNTLSWSCRADTQAELGEMTAKLNGNEEYLAWALAAISLRLARMMASIRPVSACVSR